MEQINMSRKQRLQEQEEMRIAKALEADGQPDGLDFDWIDEYNKTKIQSTFNKNSIKKEKKQDAEMNMTALLTALISAELIIIGRKFGL
jgi:hypothetical protein